MDGDGCGEAKNTKKRGWFILEMFFIDDKDMKI